MFTSDFPRDKERGAHAPAPQIPLDDQHAAATTERQQFNRQIAFLLSLLWIFWMLGSLADTVLSIDWPWQRSFSFNPLTPLQSLVYNNRFFFWLFLRYPHSLVQGGVLDKVCMVSLTMCALLLVAYGNTSKSAKDDVASAVSYLTLSGVLLAAKMLGCSDREIFILFMPFVWLLTESAIVLVQRAGVADVGAALGFTEKWAHWTWNASRGAFLATHVYLFGWKNELVILMVLAEGVNRLWRVLG